MGYTVHNILMGQAASEIKKFWNTSGNAVRIQIYCAIITYNGYSNLYEN